MTRPAKISAVLQSYTVCMANPSCSRRIGMRGADRRRYPGRGSGSCFLIGVLALLAAGCNDGQVPRGQVVAVVDGVEITLAELNDEARTRGLAIGHDLGVRDALLQELVDRKLLVRQAVEQGFDKSPNFLLAKRRADEILLAQHLLADAAQAWTYSDEEVAKFIAANPHMFDQRRVLSVDQITVPRELPEPVRRALLAQPDIAAMEELLARVGVKGKRSSQQWDSATLSREWASTLLPLQPGAAFALRGPNRMFVGKILALVPEPVPAAQRGQVARGALTRSRAEMILKRIVERERSKVDIRYQPAFAPGAAARK